MPPGLHFANCMVDSPHLKYLSLNVFVGHKFRKSSGLSWLPSMIQLLAAEAEVKKFRDQFYYAEQELAAAKGREQALQEQLLKEVNDSHERIKKQIQSHSELEVQLINL